MCHLASNSLHSLRSLWIWSTAAWRFEGGTKGIAIVICGAHRGYDLSYTERRISILPCKEEGGRITIAVEYEVQRHEIPKIEV